MAKRGLPKGTKFLKINNFRISEKRWNNFIKMADKSNAMLEELGDTDLFGKISTGKDKFANKGEFDKLFKRLKKRTKMSAYQYKTYREKIFQRNYEQGLYDVYGERKNIDEIVSKIESMKPDEFYSAYKKGILPSIYSFYNEYDDYERWNIIRDQIRTAEEFV